MLKCPLFTNARQGPKFNFIMLLQHSFFPMGFLVLVSDHYNNNYQFLYKLSDTGFPLFIAPACGAYRCYSEFDEAKKHRDQINGLNDGFIAWVVKIRTVREILDDKNNRFCFPLHCIDSVVRGDWFILKDSLNEVWAPQHKVYTDFPLDSFLVNAITEPSEENPFNPLFVAHAAPIS